MSDDAVEGRSGDDTLPAPVVEFEVPDALADERVDRAVALVTGWARTDVQSLARQGAVHVDGQPVAKSTRLRPGAFVEVLAEPEPDAPPQPESLPLVVRHEDDDVVVIAKPAGLVVHPGAGNEHGTLVNGLLAIYPDMAGVGDPMRPGIVHRLDRDTSGLMMVARSAVAYDALIEQLGARRVTRRYVALVWGHPKSARGVIDAPIGRSRVRRTRMAVKADGREARTAFDVVARYVEPEVALVHCELETGRTHQIRVHLAAIGHAVVGDAAYRGARQTLAIGRPFLHAAHLGFEHPVSGQRLEFDEALPAELAAVVERLSGSELHP